MSFVLLIKAILIFSTEFTTFVCISVIYRMINHHFLPYKDPECIVPVLVHGNIHFSVDGPVIDLHGTPPHNPCHGQGAGTGLDVSRKRISNKIR